MSLFYANEITCQCGGDLRELPANNWKCYNCGVKYGEFETLSLSKERVQSELDGGARFDCMCTDRTTSIFKHEGIYCYIEYSDNELLPLLDAGWFKFDGLWDYVDEQIHVFIKRDEDK